MDELSSMVQLVDGTAIPYDCNWESFAISLSGGADSALLCYLLCDLHRKYSNTELTVHILSHTRMWKLRPWQHYDSLRVFNFMLEEFPNIKFERHTNFISPELEWGNKGPTLVDEYGKIVSGDNIEIRAFAEFVCCTHKIPAYFNAVTKNPSTTFFRGLKTRDVIESKENKHLKIVNHMGILACHPFRFIDKRWIIKQYYRLGLQRLLEITRSCEGDNNLYPNIFKGLDYRTYVPYQTVPACGKCFWCNERDWAIKTLGNN